LIPEGATTVVPAAATPATSAPEVAGGWPAGVTASVRSDVYSLGATAYWLLDRMERPGWSGCSVRMAGGLRICVGCWV
jgi:hypothetical protein